MNINLLGKFNLIAGILISGCVASSETDRKNLPIEAIARVARIFVIYRYNTI
jgi:hypothetical protein